eukprot:symbB.v1.2.031925.t1/scaffold3761.1/size50811/3
MNPLKLMVKHVCGSVSIQQGHNGCVGVAVNCRPAAMVLLAMSWLSDSIVARRRLKSGRRHTLLSGTGVHWGRVMAVFTSCEQTDGDPG